jgi:hypothetical protein
MEYLLGMSEDESPRALNLSESLQQLIAVARSLPTFRQRDLVHIAEMYLDQKETDDTLLMNAILERINEVGTEEAENMILDLFESFRLAPSDTAASSSAGSSGTLPPQ